MSFSGIFAAGISGVTALSQSLEAVSSNIANSQTEGYKRIRTDFSDLIPADVSNLSETIGTGVVGRGVTANSSVFVGEQGGVTRTSTPTNIAVTGQGLFVVAEQATANDDSFLFTRAGDFTANNEGDLINSAGYFLQGVAISAAGTASIGEDLNGLQTVNVNRVPPNTSNLGALVDVRIDDDGIVSGSYTNGEIHALFQIPLALFRNLQGLENAESTAFRNTAASGDARLSIAGENSAGLIENSAIEISTVDIGQEFSTLIETQRAYSTNARLISVADELLQTLNSTAR